uniref:SPRY-associated domain-containing protein n=1 Tax=Labrus bergylta TaxID=56723 RepID=A0A3Q3FA82_9LABR
DPVCEGLSNLGRGTTRCLTSHRNDNLQLCCVSFSPSDACELELDTNTVNRELKLSDNNRKVTWGEELQSYPDHPDRFDNWCSQLLCRTGLTGRCYWEVEWRGKVDVSVSYRGIRRRGNSDECWFGFNDQSWSLFCSDRGYLAVYVDCPAGSLSFYRVSSDTLIHLHTFNTTFTEPLYPGFGFWSPETLLTEDQLTLFTLSSWSVSWLGGVIMGWGW